MAHELEYLREGAESVRSWSPLDELWKPSLLLLGLILVAPVLLVGLGFLVYVLM